jgi:hypothetical protein
MESHFMKFQTQAAELGDAAVPGMIEVLARGPIELHMAAGSVLACNGVGIETYGSTIEDFEYRLTGPGRQERIVRPTHVKASDISEDAFFTFGPQLTDAYMKRSFLQYFVMFGIAIVLAFAAANTGGIVGNVLWILAGLLFAITLWSVLFMTLMQWLRVIGKKLGTD